MKRNTLEIILNNLEDGDIINTSGKSKWWELHVKLAYFGIRQYQKKLFGKTSDWEDTHTAIYFRGKIYSCEPPKVRIWTPEEYFKDNIRYSIYRYTKRKFTEQDIDKMQLSAEEMLGTKYDYGQLMNILMNGLLGYSYDEKVKWFDFGAKLKVCSVYVGIIFQRLRQETNDKFERLFSKLNYMYWSKEMIRKFASHGNGWDVENITPAHFANTKQFDNEFEKILLMYKQKVYYIKEY